MTVKEVIHVYVYPRNYRNPVLAVLAMGIGLLILVCWALAVCAERDSYLEKDYRVK